MSFVLPLLTGLLSGIVGSGVWEGTVKRYRDRRDLAAVFATELDEVAYRANYVRGWYLFPEGARVPRSHRIDTPVFDALSPRLLELRPDEVSALLRIYSRVRAHNAYAAQAWEKGGSAGWDIPGPIGEGVRTLNRTTLEDWRVLVGGGGGGLVEDIIRLGDVWVRAARVRDALRARYPRHPFRRDFLQRAAMPGPESLDPPLGRAPALASPLPGFPGPNAASA